MTGRSSPLAYVRKHAAFLVLVVVVLTIPAYLGDAYYLSILARMASRFMAVLGLSLLVGQAGQISLGQAAFVGIGAYGSALLTTRVGLDPWLAMVLAAIMSAVIAGLIGIPTLKLKGYYLAMATLGVNEIVHILLVQLKGLTRGTDGVTGIPSLAIGGWDLGQPRAYHLVAWAVALVMMRLALNLCDSRVGRSLRALHRSETAAESAGVSTAYRKVQVFMIAAVFASIGGSFEAHYIQYISPEKYTISVSIVLITAVIVGGLRSPWGALWGAVFIVIVPEVLDRLGLGDYTLLVFGVVLVVLMTGLLGRSRVLLEPLLSRRAERGTGRTGPPGTGER